MSDIQVENGSFTRIHNTILEQLARLKLTGRESNCLFFLFRKTYGYGKKSDAISIAQWMDGVGFTQRHHAMKVLDSLANRRIIIVTENGNNRAKTYGFNKHFESWDSAQTVTQQGTSLNPTSTLQGSTLQGTSSPPTSTLWGTKTSTLQGTHKRKKKTTTTTGGGGGVEVSEKNDSEYRAVVDAYQNEIGFLTPMIAEQIVDAIKEFGGGQNVIRAISIAVNNNRRTWAYINGVLKRQRAEGVDGGKHNVSATEANVPDDFEVPEVTQWQI